MLPFKLEVAWQLDKTFTRLGKAYQLSRTKRLGQVVGESLKEMRALVVGKESDRYFTTSGEQGIDLARDEL